MMDHLIVKCPMCGKEITIWHYVYSSGDWPTIVTYKLNVLGEKVEVKRCQFSGKAKDGDHCPDCFGVVPYGTLERMFKAELIDRIRIAINHAMEAS